MLIVPFFQIAAICQEAGMHAVRKNRYVILPKDFEKGYRTNVKKPETDFDFYKWGNMGAELNGLSLVSFITTIHVVSQWWCISLWWIDSSPAAMCNVNVSCLLCQYLLKILGAARSCDFKLSSTECMLCYATVLPDSKCWSTVLKNSKKIMSRFLMSSSISLQTLRWNLISSFINFQTLRWNENWNLQMNGH